MNKREYPQITVSRKAEKSLREGHPWVFEDEICNIDGQYQNGNIVDVVSDKGKYLGSGFINDHSKIRIRILSKNANDLFDEAFFKRRIRYAVDYRKTVMENNENSYRVVFGEADQLPGLTVDRFENVLVTQVLSLGIELRKEWIYQALLSCFHEDGVSIDVLYERNDVSIREKEGLQEYKGFYAGKGLKTDTDGHVIIKENGILYDVDYINGQKTGFFLDQKFNRRAVASIAREKTVLDCFTHTGAFALNAALAGAKRVTAVDVSEYAIECAKSNAMRNQIPNMDFLCTDVFELLTDLDKTKNSPYDFIILDPPAFTKSSQTAQNAYRGYKEINMKAMKILPRGGYLATCSCSHFMTNDMFHQMLIDAANDAGVTVRQIEERQQGRDHPILSTVRETDYLKFYLLQII